MNALLLLLALGTGGPPPCDLLSLQREEARLSKIILATPQGEKEKLRRLFEDWDRAVERTNACIILLGGIPPEE
jgi:hypothetical protein